MKIVVNYRVGFEAGSYQNAGRILDRIQNALDEAVKGVNGRAAPYGFDLGKHCGAHIQPEIDRMGDQESDAPYEVVRGEAW